MFQPSKYLFRRSLLFKKVPGSFCPSRPEETRLGVKVVQCQDLTPLAKGAFVLLGAPDDRGVRIAGGRVGAKQGPDAIRQELYRMTVGAQGELEKPKLYDLGNLRLSLSQTETYENLAQRIHQILKAGAFPILLGGGHDLSFGGLKGFLKSYPTGGVINIDPHFDCRPKEKDGRCSSGVAFRLLFEEKKLRTGHLACFGYQTERNSQTHSHYLKKKRTQLVHREEATLPNFRKTLRRLAKSSAALGISFDIDCVDAAWAPGVSALNVNGFSQQEVLGFMHEVAKNKKVKYLDVMEVNPACDPDGRTARLAALLIYHFILCRVKSRARSSMDRAKDS